MALLSEYGFNEGSGLTAADSSGNGYDLTASNSSTSWSAGGKTESGTLREFTGVVGPNSSKSSWTVMAWVKRTGTWSGFAGILTSPDNNFYLEADANNAYIPNCYADITTAFATTPLPLNNWVHVAVVSTSNNIQLFVNGAAEGANEAANAMNFGNSVWVVNPTAVTGNENSDFVGIVDEVRVFDTALTAGQITTYMNTPISTPNDVTPIMWVGAS